MVIAELLHDTMLGITAESDAAVIEWERKEAQRAALMRYRKTVPERYREESLDTYRTESDMQKKALAVCRAFSESVQGGAFRTLIFLGAVGTGKTHLACGILRECGGLYRTSAGIVEEIRRAKSFSAKETEADILRSYAHARLLVIDEIGRGSAASEEQYMLYHIINERYNTKKPCVLISNQNKKAFLEYIGIAAADRLTESALTVEFAGNSYRARLRQGAGNDVRQEV